MSEANFVFILVLVAIMCIGYWYKMKCSNSHINLATLTINPYVVKVINTGTTVGHLPKEISSTCSLLLGKGK